MKDGLVETLNQQSFVQLGLKLLKNYFTGTFTSTVITAGLD